MSAVIAAIAVAVFGLAEGVSFLVRQMRRYRKDRT